MLALLFIKHFIADFVLQTSSVASRKHKYFYMHHSYMHMVLTFAVLIFFVEYRLAATLAVLDFIVHHNVDYVKTKLSKNLTQADRKYWIYFGVDQLLHALTYLAIFKLTKI